MASERRAVIVDAVRTPIGKRGGMLSGWHPADLAACTLRGLCDRNSLDPSLVADVIMGCVSQVGEQAFNVGRNAVLAAGWPESVPATTVDRQCGSSQQAVHFAAQGVIAGAYDVVVAAGVEAMSRIPMGASLLDDQLGHPFPDSMNERYAASGLPSQGIGAELIAEKYGLSRADLDAFGAQSQQRAALAAEQGRYEREMLAVEQVVDDAVQVLARDEGIRPDTTVESLSKLRPSFVENGKITAGSSSQLSDGAAAVLIMEEQVARRLGYTPRARFHTFAVIGSDPVTMLQGPVPATHLVLERAGMKLDDVDLVEINEAFASVVLVWASEFDSDLDNVNVNGGAIALGHPLGCSGARLMATLLNELERSEGTVGLQTMCEGGGLANATIIERIC